MNCSVLNNHKDIVEEMLFWIKSFSQKENGNQTDVKIWFAVGGLAGSLQGKW